MAQSNHLKVDQMLTLTIDDLSREGQGIAHVDSYPIFIPQALPGEKIQIRLTLLGQHIGHGRIIKILKESPNRTKNIMDSQAFMSTIPLSHMTYDAQLKFKQSQVHRVFYKNAGLDLDIPPVTPADEITGYRNKAQIPVQMIDDLLTTGIFKRGSHQLIPVEDFIIQDPKIDQIIITVRDILRKYELMAYDEENHSGDIRHIIVRRGHYTGEVMIVLVTRTFSLPHRQEIINELSAAVPELVALIQNINSGRTNTILGSQAMVLFGQDAYTDRINNHEFKISHRSFFQVNTMQTEKLYQIAVDFADLNGHETVVDAYCGIGTLSLSLAEKAGEVYGVEIISEAIRNAEENAKHNQIANAHFEVGAAEEWLVKKQKSGMKVDVIVVDPPRKGLAPSFIKAAGLMQPEKIVYVSCNPATQARDVQLFKNYNYQITKIQPVDMFPQTSHVENIILLEKSKF